MPPPLPQSARNRLASTASDLAIAAACGVRHAIAAASIETREIGKAVGEAAEFDAVARREPDRAFRLALAIPHPWRMNRLAMLDLLPSIKTRRKQ